MDQGAEGAGKGRDEGLPLMSKLIAVRPTRKASNTGGKFSEKAWERAARTWTRQKTIWNGRAGVRSHWRDGWDENRQLLSDNC